MKLTVKKGSTNKRIAIFVQDSSQTDGRGLTGLAHNTANLAWYYWREDAGNTGGTSVTLASATRGTFTSGGFVEKDSTNMPGFYEIGVPDAALATGASWVTMILRGATNMAPVTIELELFDNSEKDVYDIVSHATYGNSAIRTALDAVDDLLDTEVAAIKTVVDAIQAKTDNLPSDPADASVIAGRFDTLDTNLATVDTVVDAIKAKTDNLPSDPADASDIVGAFTTVNGKLDTIDDFLDTEILAIKAKTDNLPASPAAVSDIPTAAENADALLDRNVAGGSSTGRTVKQALYFLRNKVDAANGKVYETDDTTESWTFTSTTSASAEPITVIDPA